MTILTESKRVPPITLATRLRLSREWRDLDQQYVADELGISRQTVSNYETGKTGPGKLQLNAWAVVTDVEVEWLKTGIEQTDTGPDDGGTVTALYQSGRAHKSQNSGSNVFELFPNIQPMTRSIEAA